MKKHVCDRRMLRISDAMFDFEDAGFPQIVPWQTPADRANVNVHNDVQNVSAVLCGVSCLPSPKLIRKSEPKEKLSIHEISLSGFPTQFGAELGISQSCIDPLPQEN